jgi:hypothetical protein
MCGSAQRARAGDARSDSHGRPFMWDKVARHKPLSLLGCSAA